MKVFKLSLIHSDVVKMFMAKSNLVTVQENTLSVRQTELHCIINSTTSQRFCLVGLC